MNRQGQGRKGEPANWTKRNGEREDGADGKEGKAQLGR